MHIDRNIGYEKRRSAEGTLAQEDMHPEWWRSQRTIPPNGVLALLAHTHSISPPEAPSGPTSGGAPQRCVAKPAQRKAQLGLGDAWDESKPRNWYCAPTRGSPRREAPMAFAERMGCANRMACTNPMTNAEPLSSTSPMTCTAPTPWHAPHPTRHAPLCTPHAIMHACFTDIIHDGGNDRDKMFMPLAQG